MTPVQPTDQDKAAARELWSRISFDETTDPVEPLAQAFASQRANAEEKLADQQQLYGKMIQDHKREVQALVVRAEKAEQERVTYLVSMEHAQALAQAAEQEREKIRSYATDCELKILEMEETLSRVSLVNAIRK